jgi:hypothetical protein
VRPADICSSSQARWNRYDRHRFRTKQILVAGIGNAWLRDDGFGGEVAKLLAERQLPDGRRRRWTSAPAGSTSPTR